MTVESISRPGRPTLARLARLAGIALVAGLLLPVPALADPPTPQAPPAPAAPAPVAEHWAFRPIGRPAPPGRGHPIDAFVAAGLQARQLTPNPPAAPRDLVRRVYFDLLGLPPSPEDVDAFEQDPSPDRFERLVDRLLAQPQYGERWGRHWLDAARFTESTGFEYDRLRDHAWPYRDYVIRSFNEDKPYDRFMREQVAGDVLEPVTLDGLIGPALLVCGPYDQAGNAQANATQRAITREEEMEDLLAVVGQTFLGLTLNCARCHDHKFDPIPLSDYYRLEAVFAGVQHGERPLETPDAAQAREAREALAAARVGPGPAPSGSTAAATNLPPVPVAYVGKRVQPAPTRILRRGDVKAPGDVVAPGAPAAITAVPADFALAPDAPEALRRRRFADWLADPRNPLPARVLANRVWQLHFGQGLVATPNDFGAAGARPSHPELLDWLAGRLIDGGWSIKALHRLIVTSATYRQSSRHDARAAAVDADNQFLWRFAPRRLEAEAVRDAMLAVSGQLNPRPGGPSFRPFTTTDFNATFYHPFDKDDPEFNRRTVYRMNVNSGKDPLLDAFDCPDPSVKTPRRGVTITPLQALALMNSSFVHRQAARLAERARALGGPDPAGAVAAAYRLALGRPPSPEESRRAVEAAARRDLANVCWVLLNSTEFLYVR